MVGGTCSGLSGLTNQSRLGFLGGGPFNWAVRWRMNRCAAAMDSMQKVMCLDLILNHVNNFLVEIYNTGPSCKFVKVVQCTHFWVRRKLGKWRMWMLSSCSSGTIVPRHILLVYNLCVKVRQSFTQMLIHRQDGRDPGTTFTLLSSFCVSGSSCVTPAAGKCGRGTADPVAGEKWVSFPLIHLNSLSTLLWTEDIWCLLC